MITIGRMTTKIQKLFRILEDGFSRSAFRHFWQLVLAMTISHGATLDRLSRQLRGSTHWTKHGEYFWQSTWDRFDIVQQIARDTLKHLYRKKGGQCIFIIDETQTLKRAWKMVGVGSLFCYYLCPVMMEACR